MNRNLIIKIIKEANIAIKKGELYGETRNKTTEQIVNIIKEVVKSEN